MASSDDLTPAQLREIAKRAAAFRDWCHKLHDRGVSLRWPRDDVMLQRLQEAEERASWLAVHCGSAATRKEG